MTTVEQRQDAHKVGWLDGITDLLNTLEGVAPMLGHGTEYVGPFPDELAEWVCQQREQVAELREWAA